MLRPSAIQWKGRHPRSGTRRVKPWWQCAMGVSVFGAASQLGAMVDRRCILKCAVSHDDTQHTSLSFCPTETWRGVLIDLTHGIGHRATSGSSPTPKWPWEGNALSPLQPRLRTPKSLTTEGAQDGLRERQERGRVCSEPGRVIGGPRAACLWLWWEPLNGNTQRVRTTPQSHPRLQSDLSFRRFSHVGGFVTKCALNHYALRFFLCDIRPTLTRFTVKSSGPLSSRVFFLNINPLSLYLSSSFPH